MKKSDSISILICVYKKDNPKHLISAFNSLKVQSKFIYEIILVKDGPLTKELEKIISRFRSMIKINIVSIKKNVGLAKALNIGLKKVKTNWIARFDSDDICHKNRFRNAKQIIKDYGNEIDIFGTYMKEFENNINDKNKIRYVPLQGKRIKNNIIFSNPMNHISVIFKKELVHRFSDDTKSFYPLINGFEDYALWIKLINNGVRFRNFPIVTVYARVGKDMLKRRGGIKYIINEIKFRKFTFKYFNTFDNLLILIISSIRITIFLLPINLKKIFYLFKRKFL